MYGLIGYPLGHSFSKSYFNEKFKFIGVNDTYELFPIQSIDRLPSIIKANKLKGFNVTIPYKQDILKYLTDIAEDAKDIGAVNVVKVKNVAGELELYGYNTDWLGFRDSLIPLLRPDIKAALILGTGGASKAVAYALKRINIDYKTVSREISNGDLIYDNLSPEIIGKYKLIINATPLGTFPDTESCPNIPYQSITSSHICYDLVYNPEITEFLKRCANQGAIIKNGLEMLYRQADFAWEIWNE